MAKITDSSGRNFNSLLLVFFAVAIFLLAAGCTQSPPAVTINESNASLQQNNSNGTQVIVMYKCPDGRTVSDQTQCASCPASCDDNNSCTVDLCSNETNFQCVHAPKNTTECTAPAAPTCAGGDIINGTTCVCRNDSDVALNGVCTKTYCVVDWGGNKIEKIPAGNCSQYYNEGSYDRIYCQPDLQQATNCTICGCQAGVACVNGACQNRTTISTPPDAISLGQTATRYDFMAKLDSISNDGQATIDISNAKGAGLQTLKMKVGDTVAQRFNIIGYFNFTLLETNFDLDYKYRWARFSYNAYTTPCVTQDQGKSIAFTVPSSTIMGAPVTIVSSSPSQVGLLVKTPNQRTLALNQSNGYSAELFTGSGLYLASCSLQPSYANVSITSTRPFDYQIISAY